MFRQLVLSASFVAMATVSAAAQQSEVVLRKVEVPGADYDIVFAIGRHPVAVSIDRLDTIDPLDIHPIWHDIAHATTDEIQQIFKDVGVSVLPIHAFRVEMRGIEFTNAFNVYVLPKIGAPIQ
jgi:hypothetical protein